MSNYYPATIELLKRLNTKAYIGYLLFDYLNDD